MSPRPARIEPDDILDAAARVIAERGIAALRLQDVARAAGVSVGLIQYRFGTRETLIVSALRRSVVAASENWAVRAGRSNLGWAHIVALIDGVLEDAPGIEERWRRWAITAAALARDPELQERIGDPHARWHAPLEAAIREAVVRGEAEPVMDVADAAAALSGMLDGLGFAAVSNGDGLTLSRARSIATEHAAAMLRVREDVVAEVSRARRSGGRTPAAARASRAP